MKFKTINSGDGILAENASSHLVNELLAVIFGDQDDTVTFESRLQDFFYDPATHIVGNNSLTVLIGCGEVVEARDRIEICLAGRVEGQVGQATSCSFYIRLWGRQHDIFSLQRRLSGVIQTIPLAIELGNCSAGIADAVFGVELHDNQCAFGLQPLGYGSGYLVFGREGHQGTCQKEVVGEQSV